MAQDFCSSTRRKNGRIAGLCNHFYNAVDGQKDKPGGIFIPGNHRKTLDPKYCDHPLFGDWVDHRDCHIKPDLVLIYRKPDDVLQLVRLGSHSELGL